VKTITGIFRSRKHAEHALQELRSAGLLQEQLSLLTPDTSAVALNAVPTTDTEQPGMGGTLGAVVGGATGLSGGVLSAAVASLFLPGVGSLVVLGAAALGGVIGTAAGTAVGNTLEESLTTGLPRDELFVYENALRQGRSVVITLVHDEEQARTVRDIFARTGVESIDAAREQWWLGLRDAEESVYDAPSEVFAQVEQLHRSGFEAALDPRARGKSYDEATAFLREQYSTMFLEEPFRRGYDRGQAHQQGLWERHKREIADGDRVEDYRDQ
jgi:hypothetical protein